MIQLTDCDWLFTVGLLCVCFTEQASAVQGPQHQSHSPACMNPALMSSPWVRRKDRGPCHNKFSLFVQNGSAALCCIFILHIFTVVFRNIKCLDETDDHPALIACRANYLELLSLLAGACQQQCFALIACACGCSQKIWNFTMHHDFSHSQFSK